MTIESSHEQPHILGVLASGGGSNFMAIDDAIRDGCLPNARIGVVLSDKEDAGALDIARQREIPALFLGNVNNDQRNETIADAFQSHDVVMGVGAGYLKLVGSAVLSVYPNSVLNIHPAPLYRFGGKGMHGLLAHQAVIESRIPWSGPTVHIMDEVYDQGQILAHVQVPVLRGDTPQQLADRVLPYEHGLFWKVIAQQLERGLHPDTPTDNLS
jgi:folate-dependent phosphoribosylglycinamide formyltransferase PurN